MCIFDLPRGRAFVRREACGGTWLAWVFLGVVLAFGFGCNVAAPEKKSDPRVHQASDIAANAEQIRLRSRGLVQPMTGVIVASANEIMDGTTDPAIRRAALVWKIEAVPALREALFQPNPITSVADAWAFTFQMTDYFATGPGAKALGDKHDMAVATGRRLEAEMAKEAAAVTASGDVARTREYIRKWAADNPIRNSISGRESVLSHVAESELAASFSATQALGSVVVSVDDLNRRLEIYSAQVLDQSRWQAELLVMDLMRENELDEVVPLAKSTVKSTDRAVETLNRLFPTMERSLAVVEKTPALVTAEREATVKAMSAEIANATLFAQKERVATLEQLSTQRLATEREVDEILTQQRRLLTRDAEAIAHQAVEQAFLRGVELCAAALAVVFLGLILLMFIGRWVFARPRIAGSPP